MKRIEKLLDVVLKARIKIQKAIEITKHEETIYDLKGLDNHLGLLERVLGEFSENVKHARNANDILNDPAYTTRMAAWTDGLMIRIEDYLKKLRKFRYEIAHKYWDATIDYVDTIIKNVDRWKKGINLIGDLPDIPS